MLDSAPYNGICDTIVHSSKVDDDDGWNEEEIRRMSDHGPNIGQRQWPPLEDEDDDEDGHHLGGVPVSSGVHVDQLGRLSHLDEDRSVGKGDCAEQEDLDDADYLSVYHSCSRAHVDEAPEVNVFLNSIEIIEPWAVFSNIRELIGLTIWNAIVAADHIYI